MSRIQIIRRFSAGLTKRNQYTFYDLISRNHASEPIEADSLSKDEIKKLSKGFAFEGSTKLFGDSAEERISRVFGKGSTSRHQASSRFEVAEPKTVAGIEVPARPIEPDNCCMSGCINCVWEIYNDDIKDWQHKRRLAVSKLESNGGEWPENFDPPSYLRHDNLPKSLKSIDDGEKKNVRNELLKKDNDSSWDNVPVSIRVFAEIEKKLKQKHRKEVEQENLKGNDNKTQTQTQPQRS